MRGTMMGRTTSGWFVVAGACFVAAALAFGGRSQLLEWLGESTAYRVAMASAWVLLAAGAGALTRGFTDRTPDGEAPHEAAP